MGASEQSSLGRLLKNMREARRLSLRDVERKTAISNAYLSQLENELIEKPSPHVLYKLAELYGVDYNYLMQKTGYFVLSDQPKRSNRKGSRSFALSSMDDVSPEEEESLVEYLAFLRSRKRKRK